MGDAEYVPRPELDDAAGILLGIGCADPFRSSSEVRLGCLWAAELLREAGARPSRRLGLGELGDVSEKLVSVVTALDRLADEGPQQVAIVEVVTLLGELLVISD